MCRRYWDRLTGGAIQIGLLLDKRNLWRDCFDEWGCSVPGDEAVVAQDEVEQRLGGHRQRAIGQAHQADVAAGEGVASGMKRNAPGSAGNARRGRVVMPMPASIMASSEIMFEM